MNKIIIFQFAVIALSVCSNSYTSEIKRFYQPEGTSEDVAKVKPYIQILEDKRPKKEVNDDLSKWLSSKKNI